MARETNPSGLWRQAFSQAGSAVVRVELGVDIGPGEVCLTPAVAPSQTGRTVPPGRDQPRSVVESQVIALLAGPVAQQKWQPSHRTPDNWRELRTQALALLQPFTESNPELAAHFTEMRLIAEQLMDNAKIWAAVEKVAEALVTQQRLTAHEIVKIVKSVPE